MKDIYAVILIVTACAASAFSFSSCTTNCNKQDNITERMKVSKGWIYCVDVDGYRTWSPKDRCRTK